jgi:hypothetical protein
VLYHSERGGGAHQVQPVGASKPMMFWVLDMLFDRKIRLADSFRRLCSAKTLHLQACQLNSSIKQVNC